jgi:HK97 family phage major capsid protein
VSHSIEGLISQLRERRSVVAEERLANFARRQACLDNRRERHARTFNDAERTVYRQAAAGIKQADEQLAALDERLRDLEAEVVRSGKGNVNVEKIRSARNGSGADAQSASEQWARQIAQRIAGNGREQRAITSGTIDVPSLILPSVVDLPFPKRLTDLMGNRVLAQSNSIEYFRQISRVNNAAPVPDLSQKPVSQFTIEAIQDRCRVIATLSEPIPYRYLSDVEAVTPWINRQIALAVLAALETEVISGNATGEHMQGLMTLPGVTQVPYNTDPLTSIRSGFTALQQIGEEVNGIALHPVDAQNVDTMRWGTQGGLLSSGFDRPNTIGYGSSNNFFGDDDTVRRVVSPYVPQGTAIMGDWSTLCLFIREGMSLLMNYMADSVFEINAYILRCEIRAVVGWIRPQAMALVKLTSS